MKACNDFSLRRIAEVQEAEILTGENVEEIEIGSVCPEERRRSGCRVRSGDEGREFTPSLGSATRIGPLGDIEGTVELLRASHPEIEFLIPVAPWRDSPRGVIV